MEPGMLSQIILEFGTLIGFASVVALLVNVGKLIGFVKDGMADKWVAGLNLLGVIALYVTRLVVPDFDVIQVDTVLGEVALAGVYVMGFVGMLLGSKLTYFAAKGLPVIGTSNSQGSQAVVVISSPTEGTTVETTTTVVDAPPEPERPVNENSY